MCCVLCVYVCMCVCTCACVYVYMHACVFMYGLGACTYVHVGVGVSAYMHACACGESREPLFLPGSFSCIGGSEGIWLITQQYWSLFSYCMVYVYTDNFITI